MPVIAGGEPWPGQRKYVAVAARFVAALEQMLDEPAARLATLVIRFEEMLAAEVSRARTDVELLLVQAAALSAIAPQPGPISAELGLLQYTRTVDYVVATDAGAAVNSVVFNMILVCCLVMSEPSRVAADLDRCLRAISGRCVSAGWERLSIVLAEEAGALGISVQPSFGLKIDPTSLVPESPFG